MRRILAGALALGLLAAAAPPAAEAGHRHSRSCGHAYRYDSRGYRYGNRYDDRYDYRYSRDYRYDRSYDRGYYDRGYYDSGYYDYGYSDYGYRPYYASRVYVPYVYYSRPPYRRYRAPYRYGYGPRLGVRVGGPHVGVYLDW